MNSFFKSMSTASSGMRAQGFRIRLVSENIANTDTPGYRKKVMSFDNTYDAKMGVNKVEASRISLDQSPLELVHNPAHPLADDEGNIEMSNVNLIYEMADGREASRSYEANLASFQQARQMYSSLLDMLRR